MLAIPGKIPIRVFPFFWLLIAMIGWLSSGTVTGTLVWAVVILVSVLIHEYGHALTAIFFGQQAEIDLVGLGGLTRRSGAKIKLWQEFFIVLNGPLAGFLLFILASYSQPFFLGDRFVLIPYALQVAIYVNLTWTILNLLPVQPLDGGHLLRIVLEGLLGFQGVKISFLISLALAGVLSLYFFLTRSLFAGVIFLMLAFESYRAWSEIKTVTPQDNDADLQDLLKEAQDAINQNQHHEAFSKLLLLREQTKNGVLFIVANQLIARLLAQQGQIKQAYESLLPLQSQLSPEYLLFLQQLAYRLQEWEQVVKIGNDLYQDNPSTEVALLNALAYGILGQSKQAVGWLRSAVKTGLASPIDVAGKREFDSIRDSADFQSFFKTLSA